MRVQGHGSLGRLTLAAIAAIGLTTFPGCGGGGADGATSHRVGGNVSGLSGSGLMLQNNLGDGIAVSFNGPFTFPTALAVGAPYSVTVAAQPTGPAQVCSVAAGSGNGTMGSADVTGVAVTCVTTAAATYTVSGTVSGLAGIGLVLKNNGADSISVPANGSFTFPVALAAGATCSVSGGSGTMGSANVTGVAVTCVTTIANTYTVGGTVSGLNGTGLVLQLNGAGDLTVNAAGSFTFATRLATGAAFDVKVKTQASSPTQYCAVTNGTGNVAGANVASVVVNCPVSVSAVAVPFGQTHVDVTWTVIGFVPMFNNVYLSTAAGSPGELIDTINGVTGSYRVAGLAPNTAYYFTFESVNGAGAGTWSAQVTATTAATPSFPASGTPPPITGLTATRVGSVVTLSWDAYAGGGFIEVYRTVDRQFPLGSQYTVTSVLSDTFVTTLTDTIAGNGLYSYGVGIYNAALTMTAWATVDLDVPIGTLPGLERPIFDFFACGLDSSVLHVYWYAAPGAEAYHVYAAPWVGGTYPAVITPSQGGTTPALDATTPTPIYQVSPGYYGLDIPLDMLSLGTNAIAVEAVKGSYRSVGGGGNGFTRRAAAPVGVTNVRTARVNPTAMDVTWDASPGAASYRIYRLSSLFDVLDSTKLAGTSTTTSFRNTGLTPDTNSYYRVTAIAGGAGGGAESIASDCAIGRTFKSGAPLPLPPVILGLGQAWLGWIGANTHGTTYRIYGGGALLPTSVDSSILVTQTTVSSDTQRSTWNTYVSAPLAAYAVFMLSVGMTPVYGMYWIEEVFPDGTTSTRAQFAPFIFG
jgi:hypothetical protein